MTDLFSRLTKLRKLETELTRKAAPIIQPGTPLHIVDWFVMGAAQRTLAQSRGFRSMTETRNFASSAILLRTQIDTAMRINGLRYLDNPEEQLLEVFKGKKSYRELTSWQKTERNKPIRMQDKNLREWLQKEEPWIEKIYEETSDFVHLSFRPLFASIENLDDDDNWGKVDFAITGEDNTKGEDDYYEICDAFFDVSKLTCTYILAVLIARHAPASVGEVSV